jgi:hypothetical protein
MKQFLIKVLMFLVSCLIIISSLKFVSNKVIDSGNYFQIKSNSKCLILGNSHPECAFNDSIINGFCNFSVSGESYFYNYFKMRKILENNTHIKEVFIEFSNTQINNKQDDKIFSDMYLSARYPVYEPFFTLEDFILLLIKNRKVVLQAQSIALKENLLFLMSSQYNYLQYKKCGGFVSINTAKIDSLIKDTKLHPYFRTKRIEMSEISLKYLRKSIDYCKSKGVKVHFIRSPYHENHELLRYEKEFIYMKNNRFSDVDFLDFAKFPLSNDGFADYGHLNSRGSTVFSIFFNKLIQEGLLNKLNKQGFINSEMEKQNKSNY